MVYIVRVCKCMCGLWWIISNHLQS